MDAKKLSVILQKVSDILSYYDNISVEDALDDINKILQVEKRSKSNISAKNHNKLEITFTDELLNNMSKMNSEELTKFLQEHKQFQSKGALLNLAKKLSITTSSRNNLSAISYSIVKFF